MLILALFSGSKSRRGAGAVLKQAQMFRITSDVDNKARFWNTDLPEKSELKGKWDASRASPSCACVMYKREFTAKHVQRTEY